MKSLCKLGCGELTVEYKKRVRMLPSKIELSLFFSLLLNGFPLVERGLSFLFCVLSGPSAIEKNVFLMGMCLELQVVFLQKKGVAYGYGGEGWFCANLVLVSLPPCFFLSIAFVEKN